MCPSGWHLPVNAEWISLETFLGGNMLAGGKLKETGTSHWTGSNVGATNATGYTALPGGNRFGYGLFYGIGNSGYWWSSTEYDATNAWIAGLTTYGEEFNRYFGYSKHSGFSVRYIKD
jgi:uncharacterized protein (TIGR02145 family)